MFNIIMWLGMYPVVFILYFALRLGAKERNGIVFGVRFPKSADAAQEFAELAEKKRRIYYRRMRRTLLGFLVLPAFCFFIPHISVQFTIWMLWLLAAIVFLELPCIRANRELMCWKKERLLTVQESGSEEGEREGGSKEDERESRSEEGERESRSKEDVQESGSEEGEREGGSKEDVQESRSEEDKRESESEKSERKDGRKGSTPKNGSREGTPRYFELSQAGAVRRVKTGSFLLPIAVSAAAVFLCARQKETAFYQSGMPWMVVVLALCTPAFYAVAVWMDRQRTVVISRDSEINLNFARAKKQVWCGLWLFCAWANTAYTVFAAFLLMRKETWAQWVVWGCVIYMFVLLAGCAGAIRKVNRLEERYAPKTDPAVLEDDDDFWLWGCVYRNRADRRVLVEARIGFGTSVNLAAPAGKGLIIFAALAILSVPIICVWMILLEFTPIHLEIRGDELVAEQLKADYRIDISDITELTLVEELPELSKISGTGMDNLYKGKWRVPYTADCEVFLNPQNHLFLRFMSDGVLYYMSAAEDGQTRSLYEELGGR